MRYQKISENTIMRWSLYERYVSHLQQLGEKLVSSEQLARITGVNASNVRKDLQILGEVGARGIGYEVAALQTALRKVLGFERKFKLAFIGADTLGRALISYYRKWSPSFEIIHIFDEDSRLIGQRIHGITVKSRKSWEKNIKKTPIDIAVIAQEPNDIEVLTKMLVEAEVAAVLNFSRTKLPLPDTVEYKHIDLSASLNYLRFQIL